METFLNVSSVREQPRNTVICEDMLKFILRDFLFGAPSTVEKHLGHEHNLKIINAIVIEILFRSRDSLKFHRYKFHSRVYQE